MRIVCAVAVQQGAARLTDIARGHIDGCIYAQSGQPDIRREDAGAWRARCACRRPSTRFPWIARTGARRACRRCSATPPRGWPTPMSAWGAAPRSPARPIFWTTAPRRARRSPGRNRTRSSTPTACWARARPSTRISWTSAWRVTGRAPLAGRLSATRNAARRRVLDIDAPAGADDAIWPLLGYLAGLKSPDRIPLLRGLAGLAPTEDDLKALCAAFGTTSAAPMLHVEGVTPEADGRRNRRCRPHGHQPRRPCGRAGAT